MSCSESQPSFSDVLRIVLFADRGKGFSAVLYASYFDVSGRDDVHQFMTIAGAGSTEEKWKRFDGEWKKILDREGVSAFHATDFASNRGEYEDWKNDKGRRSRFLRSLIAVARTYTNKLFTVTVDLSEWRFVNVRYQLEEHFFSAFAFAGMASVDQTIQWAKKLAKKSRVTDARLLVAFEEGDPGWEGLKNLCIKYLKHEPIRLPKTKARGFELGDMLAWKTRITLTNIRKSSNLNEAERHLKGLDKLIVCPAIEGILKRKSLFNNCHRYSVPKRPVTAA